MENNCRHRAWAWTIFKNINKLFKALNPHGNRKFLKKAVKYICYGREICPKTDREHLQGFVYFKDGKSMKAAKKFLNSIDAHLEIARGSPEQNRKYCMKEGNFIEWGDLPRQGKRNDIQVHKEALENGANMRDIIINSRSNQSIQYAQKWLTYMEKKRDWKTIVYWLWGNTGLGKTTWAKSICKDKNPHFQHSTNKWWDGYDAHEVVVLDELRPKFFNYNMEEALSLLYFTPLQVAIKGGFRSMLAKVIIITSPKNPRCFFEDSSEEDSAQLVRRIEHVHEITPNFKWENIENPSQYLETDE